LYPYLTALFLLLTCTSCSDDSDNNIDNPEAVDLIVGEWLFVSENDYYCGTEDVRTERPASDNGYDQIWVFKSDMTYESYDDGVLNDAEDQMGTWESLGDGMYRLNYTVYSEARFSTTEVEFVQSNTMKFGVDDECVDFGGDNIYTYTVWTRQ
ncbi:MAG: hypothetical protein WBN55_14600, partial [Eudoraea sp.]|uniref:hypothetical protein n=1 Tax=Eudoraea sp. TaxID=1979955 RepID=UPI003C724444